MGPLVTQNLMMRYLFEWKGSCLQAWINKWYSLGSGVQCIMNTGISYPPNFFFIYCYGTFKPLGGHPGRHSCGGHYVYCRYWKHCWAGWARVAPSGYAFAKVATPWKGCKKCFEGLFMNKRSSCKPITFVHLPSIVTNDVNAYHVLYHGVFRLWGMNECLLIIGIPRVETHGAVCSFVKRH